MIGLGVVPSYRSRRNRTARVDRPVRRLPLADHGDFVQGLLGNLLNPKAAVAR